MDKTLKTLAKQENREAETSGLRRGFYFVKGGERYFISETVNPRALERIADRVLSDRTGWDYWIDYSLGPDIHGAPAWSNIDQTDKFF